VENEIERKLGVALNSTILLAAVGTLYGITRSVAVPSAPAPAPETPACYLGAGGYIDKTNYTDWINSTIDDMYAKGYRSFRYWARPYWKYGSAVNNYDDGVCDALVSRCMSKPVKMRVYVEPEHNFPPSTPFITSVADRDAWENDLKNIALHIQSLPDHSNVVLELINEYDGTLSGNIYDEPTLFNHAIRFLRENGVHLPILCNFWWNQRNVTLDDPDDNYAIGRHLYATDTLAQWQFPESLPTSLEHVCNDFVIGGSTINDRMYKYFDKSDETYYIAYAKQLGIPNGFVVTELGYATSETMLQNSFTSTYPCVAGLAYVMRFLRMAKSRSSGRFKIDCMIYRESNYAASKRALLEQKAWEYFNEPLIPP
jgi:hypothetical protein